MAYDPVSRTLVLIYNADGGLAGALLDAVHKVVSPSTYACRLCGLTYGYVSMARTWKRYLDRLPLAKRFLHRDEVASAYPGLEVALPAVLLDDGRRTEVLLDGAAINRQASLDELVDSLSTALGQHGIAA